MYNFALQITINMKRILSIFIFSFIVIGITLANNNLGLLNLAQKSSKAPVAHSAGKKLVKGTWLLGGTISAKSNNLSDVDLLIIDVEDFDQRSFNFRLEGSYFFKENVSVGLGLNFGEDKMAIITNLLDNSYKRDIREFSRTYGVLGFIKNHIPISSNNLFFVTNQTELFYGYKSGPSETYVSDILERKYATKNSVGVSIRPGILMFLTESFAFDLNMGILGFSHSEENVKYRYPENNLPLEENRKKDTKNRSTSMNLKFDLLKLGFGFSYYF